MAAGAFAAFVDENLKKILITAAKKLQYLLSSSSKLFPYQIFPFINQNGGKKNFRRFYMWCPLKMYVCVYVFILSNNVFVGIRCHWPRNLEK